MGDGVDFDNYDCLAQFESCVTGANVPESILEIFSAMISYAHFLGLMRGR